MGKARSKVGVFILPQATLLLVLMYSFSVGENQSHPRAHSLFSLVRTNLLQLIQTGVTSGAGPHWHVQVTVTCWMLVVWFLPVATDWNSQQDQNPLLFSHNYVKQVPVTKHFTFYLEFSSFVVCLGGEARGVHFRGSYSGQAATLLAGTLKGTFCF